MNLASFLRRRREWYLVPAVLALVLGWTYREVWQGGGKAGIGWDLIESYWPDLSFVAHELGRGNFPLWNPFERGGVPALGDPQTAVFYPVQLLLALWGAARGETSWLLIQVKELLHHWLAAMLLYLYLRTRRLPWQAALTGALVLVISEPWFDFKSNNFLQSVAWAPLCWIAIDALIARPSWRRAAALSAALYLPAAVGSPPGYFYTLLLVLPYGAFRLGGHLLPLLRSGARDPDARARLLRLGGHLGLAALLVLATQLIMLLPVRELLALSGRAVRTVNFAVGGESDMRIALGSLLIPHGPRVGHAGVLALILGLAALVLRPGRDRGAPLFFCLLAAFFFVLCLGPQTRVLRWLVVNLPGFGLFRASCRYLVCYPLCLGVLAAQGMTTLLDPRSRLRGPRLVVLLLGSLLLVGTAVLSRLHADVVREGGFHLPLGLVALLAVAAALALVWLPRRWALPAAAVLPLLLSLENIQTLRRASGFQARPDSAAEDRQKIAHLPGLASLEYRMFDEFLLEQRAGSRLRLRELRGYTAIDPLSRVDYQQILLAAARPASLHLLGEYNVRYVFYGPHTLKGWSRKQLPGAPAAVAPRRFRQLSPEVHETLHPAPQVAWYGAVRRVPAAAVLTTLAAARDEQGTRRHAVLTSASAAMSPTEDPRLAHLEAATATAPPGIPGKITRFTTDEVAFEVTAPAEGVVVLNEMMFPGWKVFVDGQPQPALTVDFCLRGVVVSRGSHQVRWVYRPTHLAPLLGLWMLGMLAFVASAASAFRLRTVGPGKIDSPDGSTIQ